MTVFDEDTPLNLINSLSPDILVKGGDYNAEATNGDPKYIVGSNMVKKLGGKVEVIPFLEGYSSTNIIEKIRSFKS